MCEQCREREQKSDDVRWLALLVRQGLKLIVAGIEKRYDLPVSHDKHNAKKEAA